MAQEPSGAASRTVMDLTAEDDDEDEGGAFGDTGNAGNAEVVVCLQQLYSAGYTVSCAHWQCYVMSAAGARKQAETPWTASGYEYSPPFSQEASRLSATRR